MARLCYVTCRGSVQVRLPTRSIFEHRRARRFTLEFKEEVVKQVTEKRLSVVGAASPLRGVDI